LQLHFASVGASCSGRFADTTLEKEKTEEDGWKSQVEFAPIYVPTLFSNPNSALYFRSYHPFLHGNTVSELEFQDPQRRDKVKNPFSPFQLIRVQLKTEALNGDAPMPVLTTCR
jgi:hypothetical protein